MPLVKGEDRYQMSSPDAPRPRQTDISFGCHVYEILAWGGLLLRGREVMVIGKRERNGVGGVRIFRLWMGLSRICDS